METALQALSEFTLMNLSWTFYLKGQGSVTLHVIYVPALDRHQVRSGGYLNVEKNIAYVNWNTYQLFDKASIQARKEAFNSLVRLSKGGGLLIGNERISWPDK